MTRMRRWYMRWVARGGGHVASGVLPLSLLVVVTLISEPPERLWVVYAAVGVATVWTFLTWYMARSHPIRLGQARQARDSLHRPA